MLSAAFDPDDPEGRAREVRIWWHSLARLAP